MSTTALAATGLTACGSANSVATSTSIPTVTSPASPQALAAVTKAITGTLSVTSAFDMTFSGSSSNGASAAPRDASGAVDFRGPSGTVRIDLPGAAGGTERMVFLPDTVFIKPPASTPPLQTGRPWIFANFADIQTFKINFPPYIVQTESINPAFTLYELAWGSASAAPTGRTQFHGQETEGYLVTVNLNQALAHATGPAADVFSQALASEISALGGGASGAPVRMTIQTWVGGSGQLVGAQVTPPNAGIGTLTLALTGFGAPVHADKPPRAQVVDLAAIIPGAEQEALNNGDTDGA
ncbi:MAG TPA: hypothetical protein VGG43_05355 [Acidimicrobiales bacterium]